jgi:succinyl-CoA synthetase beta subunit
MLGQQLVTKQTGPEGLPINIVYVETGSAIEREIYLSLLMDPELGTRAASR